MGRLNGIVVCFLTKGIQRHVHEMAVCLPRMDTCAVVVRGRRCVIQFQPMQTLLCDVYQTIVCGESTTIVLAMNAFSMPLTGRNLDHDLNVNLNRVRRRSQPDWLFFCEGLGVLSVLNDGIEERIVVPTCFCNDQISMKNYTVRAPDKFQ